MPKAKGGLLAGEAGLTGFGEIALQIFVGCGLSTLLKGVLQLERNIEMILDYRFAATRDEDEVLDARFTCLVNDVLDDRPVHDREHFLRDRLGGGQEARAQARHGQDSLADRFHQAATPETERNGMGNGAGSEIA
jgi:hypothetical protein